MGVIQAGENKLDDMCSILEHLHQYVPLISEVCVFQSDDHNEVSTTQYTFHNLVLGGDPLTVARVRGLQAIRCHEDNSLDRLEGFLGVPQDWHAHVTLLKVWVYACMMQHM